MDSLPLPNELVLCIVEFLDLGDVVLFGETCKIHKNIISGNAKVLRKTLETKISTDTEESCETVIVDPLGFAKVEKKSQRVSLLKCAFLPLRTLLNKIFYTKILNFLELSWRIIFCSQNVNPSVSQ
ncbi:hypothetical protein ISTM_49 [Insectomime virus]|nr:hypothetical protein ISTM_49 [Insectomime virus]